MKKTISEKEPLINPEEVKIILADAGISFYRETEIKSLKSADASLFRISRKSASYAFKIFDRDDEFEIESKSIIRFYSEAGKRGIPAAHVISSGASKMRWWVLLNWIEGTPISEFEAEEKKVFARKAGMFLRSIHEISIDEYPKNVLKNNLSFFFQRLDALQEQTQALTDDELKKLHAFADDKILLDLDRVSLLHGDFTGSNIIVSPDQARLSLIDPGEIVYGDPMMELGYTQNGNISEEFKSGVMDGYTSGKALTENEAARFNRWRALRQAVITLRAVKNKAPKFEYHKQVLSEYLKQI